MKNLKITVDKNSRANETFREKRIGALLYQLGMRKKVSLYDEVVFQVASGLNILQIKNISLLSNLEQSALGIIKSAQITSSSDILFLTGLKPKFARPMYTMKHVLLLHLATTFKDINWPQTKKFITEYMAEHNVKYFFSDNKDFSYSKFINDYLSQIHPKNKIIIVFPSAAINNQELINKNKSNSIVLVQKDTLLSSDFKSIKLGNRYRLVQLENSDLALNSILENQTFEEKVDTTFNPSHISRISKPISLIDVQLIQNKEFVTNKVKEEYFNMNILIKFRDEWVSKLGDFHVLLSVNSENGNQFIQLCKLSSKKEQMKFNLERIIFPEGRYKIFMNISINKNIIWKLKPHINILVGTKDVTVSRTPYCIVE